MPKNFRIALLLVVFSGCLVSATAAVAQSAGKLEIGANYIYTRTNAPPQGCGCFSLNGGSAWGGYNFSGNLALVGEVSGSDASNIEGTTEALRAPHSWEDFAIRGTIIDSPRSDKCCSEGPMPLES